MGSAKRLRKLYEKPKMMWDEKRLEEERKLLKEYGLRRMRELWRMQTLLRKIRREARRLLAARGAGVAERAEKIIARVKRFLIKKEKVTLDDVLALTTRDILERRLETVVLRKGLARTASQSRQLIAHGHIAVDGVKCTSPSRLVSFDDESLILWYGKPVRIDEGGEGAAEKPETAAAGKPEAKVEAIAVSESA